MTKHFDKPFNEHFGKPSCLFFRNILNEPFGEFLRKPYSEFLLNVQQILVSLDQTFQKIIQWTVE